MKMLNGFLLSFFIVQSVSSFGGAQQKGGVKMSSFYSQKALGLDGKPVDFSKFKSKTVLIVNTASRCGYTPQFKALQKIYSDYKNQGLVVIGVPSNDFKQELDTSEKIGEFCKLNYGVDFQMLQSTSVSGAKKSELFKFLVENGPDPKSEVKWNFEKFLISSQGAVVRRFSSNESPDSPAFQKQIQEQLLTK